MAHACIENGVAFWIDLLGDVVIPVYMRPLQGLRRPCSQYPCYEKMTALPEKCEFYHTFNACAQAHDLHATGKLYIQGQRRTGSYILINNQHSEILARPFLDYYRAA